MRNARRWLQPSASVCTYASARHKTLEALRNVGAAVCLLTLFLSAGGHWAVLQSIAYTGMLIEFAQKDSLGIAVQKTFDDRFACGLCPKIRAGYTKERQAPPAVSGSEHLPEFTVQTVDPLFFVPTKVAEIPFVPRPQIDFSNAPPTPPPRGFDFSNQPPRAA